MNGVTWRHSFPLTHAIHSAIYVKLNNNNNNSASERHKKDIHLRICHQVTAEIHRKRLS